MALARALALEPKVLLLDEPLSNLDANLRVVMREEIRNIQERIGITTIFVTHDQYEAMSISDRLLVLQDGIIQQIGSPMEIYEKPANEFIAGFVGYVNFLEGTVEAVDIESSTCYVTTAYCRMALDHLQPEIEPGDAVVLVIRPETVTLLPAEGSQDEQNMLYGTIESHMYAGNLSKYTVAIGNRKIIVDQYNPKDSALFRRKDQVKLEVPRTVHALKRS